MSRWLADPGHGGMDSGATGGGRYEKNDTLLVVLEFKKIMEANGEEVFLTRSKDIDVSLSGRTNYEKSLKPFRTVSFHRNSGGGVGVETFCYLTDNAEGFKLATAIQNNLVKAGLDNANGKRGVKKADFHMLRETGSPAVLVEMGFMDSYADNQLFAARYMDYAKEIARACLAQVGKTLNEATPVVNKQYYIETGLFNSWDSVQAGAENIRKLGYYCEVKEYNK